LGEALAEYRRRRFDSALQWLQRAIDSEGITPRHRAAAYFIQAGAYAARRRVSLAREAVQIGDSALKQPFDPFTKIFGDTWCDLAIANYLRREAIPLLVTASSTSEDENVHHRHAL
jgi:hypothetical protein